MDASVLLLTYNEASNLPRCLDALSWCDDVVVIDSGSSDETVEIAKSYGARILTRPFDNFANQRNYGIDEGQLKHDWVLHFDADEVTTDKFIAELKKLDPPHNIDAYYVPSKLMLGEKWLKRSGMYPAYQVRLGRTKGLRFKQFGHAQREDLPAEKVAVFSEPYLHYNFSHGLTRWFEKHVRYARDEADEFGAGIETSNSEEKSGPNAVVGWRRFLKNLAGKLPPALRPLARFIYIYFLRRGFLDGRAGLQYALMISSYEGMMATFMLADRQEMRERDSKA